MDTHVHDILLSRIDGIDIYLQQADSWVDSCKIITNYMEKRMNLEEEYAKNLQKLASSFQNSFLMPEFRSMQYIFVALISQDCKYSEDLYKMLNNMRLENYLQILNNRMQEHKKQMYFLKQIFTKEQNHMQEAINNVNKTKMAYHARCQEFEKVESQIIADKPDISIGQICISDDIKAEKKRKLIELANKLKEAFNVYQKSIKQANSSNDMLKIVQEKVLFDATNLLSNSDNILKKVTQDFFSKMEKFLSSLSSQFSILEKNSQLYEPGSSYAQNIRRLTLNSATQLNSNQSISFELYINDM